MHAYGGAFNLDHDGTENSQGIRGLLSDSTGQNIMPPSSVLVTGCSDKVLRIYALGAQLQSGNGGGV